MIHPTIHLNGTSREALVEQFMAAYTAVYDALTALYAAAPNARDYYVQGDYAFMVARAEHDARVQKLCEVMAELAELAEKAAG